MSVSTEPLTRRGAERAAGIALQPTLRGATTAGPSGASAPALGESLWAAESFKALVTGLFALPIAVALLVAAYLAFVVYARLNPMGVAAFFGSASSVDTVAPILVVLLVLAVGMVTAGWVVMRRDIKRVPLVAASACVVLSLTAAIPVLFVHPPDPPSLLSAQLAGVHPDHQGRFQAVRARLQIEVPVTGDYRLEPALNGSTAAPVAVRLEKGARDVSVDFTSRQMRDAIQASEAAGTGGMVLTLRVLLQVVDGYRPVRITECPIPRRAVTSVMAALAPSSMYSAPSAQDSVR